MTMNETAAAKFVRPAAYRPLHTRLRIWARAVVDIALVLAWLPATLTGILLWDPAGFTPTGPGRGEREMLWGYTIFAGRGFSTKPYSISRIEDRNGNVRLSGALNVFWVLRLLPFAVIPVHPAHRSYRGCRSRAV